MALTPMVIPARMVKKDHPNARISLSGPVRPRSWRPTGNLSGRMWTTC